MSFLTYDADTPSPTQSALVRTASLVLMLSVRNFRVRFRRSALGVLWVFLQPALQAGTFAFLFIRVMKVDVGDDYLAYVLTGVMPWAYFAQAVGSATSAVVDSADVVRRVAAPRVIYPLAAVGGTAFTFAPTLLILGGIAAATGHLGIDIAWLPLAVLLQTALAVGIGLIACTLYVYARDVRNAVASLLVLGFYATPLVFMPERTSASIREALRFNPLTGVASLYRAAYLQRPLDGTAVAYSVFGAVVLIAVGVMLFRRYSPYFVDQV